jgi:hypothetical protein
MNPSRRWLAYLAWSTVAVVGCPGRGDAPSDGVPSDGVPSDRASTDAAIGDGACGSRESLPLHRIDWAGSPTSIYVEATYEGRDGVLHVDTASASTLVLGAGDAGWVTDAGTVTMGCRAYSVAGFFGKFQALPDVDGLPVLGSAGADRFLEVPALLDVTGRRWIRGPTAEDLGPVAAGVDPPFEIVQGTLLVRASFDGRPVRVLVDTGAGHLLWLGEPGKLGDLETMFYDYLGNQVRAYEGHVMLDLGGETRRLPVLRVPSFPGLEALRDSLGGDLHGLLGLSAIDAMQVDAERGVLRIVLAASK